MDLAAAIISLLHHRLPDASICPSEVARMACPANAEWRTLMAPVRKAAARLARERIIVITRKGKALDPQDIGRGPIRLRRGPAFPSDATRHGGG